MRRQENNQIPRLLSTSDVAKLLKVSRSLIYELVQKGNIPSYRVGNGRGAVRISEEDVAEFLRSKRNERVEDSVNKKAKPRRTKRLRHLKG